MANLNIPNTKDRTLDAFKGRMIGGGARPNLFECELFFPADAIPENTSSDELEDKSRFLVKAAQLPASNITPIQIPFRGRNLKIAGDRTFDPWTVTVINDAQFNIRDAMEQWSNLINDLQFDVGDINPADYQTKAEVFQLSRQAQGTGAQSTAKGGEIIQTLRTYNFEGIYPNAVSSIPLDYGATDQIEEFQVTFNYLFWTTDLPGVAGGQESVTAGN